ncbi:MAG: Transcriptional regulator, TetR family [Solirubrobacterales bacterium]|nr:Transcriptional regulator, TetR family [Solirubrobacterales bacterium]
MSGRAAPTPDDTPASGGVVKPLRPTLAEATRGLLRARVLDAVDDLLRQRPWASSSMADIARVGGVSRQTVYNEFGSREALAQEYVLRETDRFLATVQQAVLDHRDDPRAAVAAAFDVFLTAAADRPLIRAIASGDGSDELLALVTTDGGPVLAIATERLAGVMQTGWPGVALEETRLVAECVVRLAISHAALPSGPADLTAASVARLLGPYLDGVLGAAG